MGLRDHAAKFEADETNTTTRSTTMKATVQNAAMPNRVTTGVVRLVYPNVAKPRPADAEIDAGKYTAMILIPKEDKAAIKALEAAIEFAGTKKFPKGLPRGAMLPLKDGDEKTDKNGDPVPMYEGMMYLNLKTINPPRIIDPCKQVVADPSFIKGGDWVRVRVSFTAYEKSGNKGVGSYMDVIQFIRPGDPLGNVDTLDDFDEEEMDDIAA
jgi:hypothetical protein